MTAWAARYSRTIEPEITIYRDGVEVARVSVEGVEGALAHPCPCSFVSTFWETEAMHDTDLRADIAARVDLRECEETQACTRHAMPDGRCREHGGRDEL